MVNAKFSRFLLTSFCTLLFLAGCTLRDDSSLPDGGADQQPAPTALSTAPPMPSQAQVQNRFDSEIEPLVKKLLAAPADPDIMVNVDDQIIYLPTTRPLLVVQMILELDNPSPDLTTARQVYILYEYSRGGGLGKAYKDKPKSAVNKADTQTITASVRVVVKDMGKSYLIEEKSASGGEGSTSYRELVEKAVAPLDKLPPEKRVVVEQDLEKIIGFACGIDMDPDLDYHWRAELFSRALTSQNWADKTQAVFALRAMNPPPAAAVSDLFSSLTDTDIGYEAGQALARFTSDPEVFQRVLNLVDSTILIQRLRAAEILGSMKSQSEAAVDPLIKLALDEDEAVRRAAAVGLARLNDSLALERLTALLEDSDVSTRQYAVDALGHFYSQALPALPKMTAMLQDPSAQIRQSSANALKGMGKKAASILPDLIAAAKKESDAGAFKSELEAIERLGGKAETLPVIKELLPYAAVEVRVTSMNLLAFYRKTPGVTGILATGLEDEAVEVRVEAARSSETLAMLESSNAGGWSEEDATTFIRALILALGDESAEVRSHSARALGHLKADASDAIPALIEAMRNSEEYDDYVFIDALQEITGFEHLIESEDWSAWWEEEKADFSKTK